MVLTFCVNMPRNSLAYDVLGVDINVKDYEFPPGRVPTNLDVLQYIESRAAKGPLGER